MLERRLRDFAVLTAQYLWFLYERITGLESRPYGPIYAIWAEEASKIDRNSDGYEWSFGNGDNCPSGEGIVIPFRSRVVALCLQIADGEAEVELRRNGESAVHDVRASGSKAVQVDYHQGGQVFEQGDVVNFRTVFANGNKGGGRVVVYLACIDESLRGLL